MSTANVTYASDGTKFHPPGLFMLFGAEMMERLSYYGMRAILVLYLVDKTRGGFGMSQEDALSLYGTYTGLVYLTPLLGGLIADNYLGQRMSIMIGGVLMMLGQFVLAAGGGTAPFYAGMALLIIGNGLFKPNISTMVGGLYRPGDPRRDTAFTIFYMGINIGAFFAPLLCGTLGEKVSWGWGFGSAGIGMAIGLVIFMALQKKLLGNVGLAPKAAVAGAPVEAKEPFTKVHKDRLVVIFVLALFVIFFWAAFEQAGGLMNLYTDSKVDRVIGSFEVPTSWLQAVNPLFIVLFGPALAVVWGQLRKRKLEPSSPAKMAVGLLLLSAGFVLMLGASKQSEAVGKAGLYWVVGAYWLHTLGELCLSPVGLSMVTKLAHQRIASLMMGVWFLANAAANKLSGVIGAYSTTLGEYQVFLSIVIGTAIAGLVLAALSVPLKKMMHGAEDVAAAELSCCDHGNPRSRLSAKVTSNALRNLPVDLDELTIAFEAEAADLQWYLDTQSGTVILVNREYEPAEHDGLTATEIETDPNRFVPVPAADPQHALDDMRSFAESVTDTQLQESLQLALSAPRPDRRFKTALSWLPEQQGRWHAWRQERCLTRVTHWLSGHGIRPARAA